MLLLVAFILLSFYTSGEFMKVLFSLFFLFSSLQASPKNPSLISGMATFSSSPNLLEVRLDDRTILNWESFSVEKKETVHLHLPHSDCRTLQRVIGKEVSTIDGLLQCNGHLYLLNPNGIVIGPKGVIDTTSFVGTTLDMEDCVFYNESGLLRSSRKKGSIVHYGTIKARNGSIALIGMKIQNHGRLETPNGIAQIGIGERFLLRLENQSHIFIEALPSRDSSNDGELQLVKAACTPSISAYAYAMHHPSFTEGKGVEIDKDSRIFLISSTKSPAKAVSHQINQMGKMNAELFYQVARATTDSLFLLSILYDKAAFCSQKLWISPENHCLPFLRSKPITSEEETTVFDRY